MYILLLPMVWFISWLLTKQWCHTCIISNRYIGKQCFFCFYCSVFKWSSMCEWLWIKFSCNFINFILFKLRCHK